MWVFSKWPCLLLQFWKWLSNYMIFYKLVFYYDRYVNKVTTNQNPHSVVINPIFTSRMVKWGTWWHCLQQWQLQQYLTRNNYNNKFFFLISRNYLNDTQQIGKHSLNEIFYIFVRKHVVVEFEPETIPMFLPRSAYGNSGWLWQKGSSFSLQLLV